MDSQFCNKLFDGGILPAISVVAVLRFLRLIFDNVPLLLSTRLRPDCIYFPLYL